MSENKSPAFQFYAENFLNGTADMTTSEVGIYIRLLCHQWHKGALPNEDRKLLQMSGGRKVDLIAAKEKFELCGDGMLRNFRMEKTRLEQIEYRKSKSESGREGAKKRWQKDGTPIDSPIANPMAKNGSSSSSSGNTFKKIMVGNQEFSGTTSEWLMLNKEQAIEVLMMQEFPKLDKAKVLEKVDSATVSYHFKDSNHPFNYFKSICRDMAKPSKTFAQPQETKKYDRL
jgi:uncharacterized protein YdaU (DUF1376 family)